MHLRLIPVTPRMVERLKAAQIAMFGDPSHGGHLHEEVVQTARGPEHRWIAGEAAPKPKKPGKPALPKTPEKGKDPNDKRTFELDDLISIHRKAQAIPRHHVYQAALQAWNHDPEARERYKEAMTEDTSAGEGPAHQRLRLWYAKGTLREAMKGLDDASFLEAVEALKALAPEVGPPPVRNRQAHPFVGTIRIPGLPKIRVETKKGETRSGVDPDGNAWSVVMPAHYGEFHGTRGVDGDPVDVFVGPDIHAPYAYVFHMSRLGEGGYDEDKAACGFQTREDAERCLRDAYDRAGIFHAPPKRLTVAELAHWLADPENKGRMVDAGREMAKGGPFIGPHGGRWADPQHTVAWKEHGVAHRALLAQAAAHSLGLCSVTFGHSTRSGKIAGLRASAAAADLVASGHLVRVSHASERETIGRGSAARQHTYSTTVYRLTDAGRAAAGEATKAVPVPVLSLTGGPVRVARVQVATETPAAGQGLAEAIREGEDIGDSGQGQGAPVTPACETCNVPMDVYRGPPWASIYGCPVCQAKTEIPNPNYRRPGSDDAPAQAPEVCKDANCQNPAHGHPPEAAKSLPAHLEID